MKYCPKVHALAKYRYQKELGQTEGDAKKPGTNEPSTNTTLTRVLSEPTFIQFPQQCTVETFDVFTSSILDGESKGWTYDRKANLRSADVSSFNSILGSSHAAIEKVVRENWINPELVKTDVWLGALRSAMFGHSHHSASPIENFQREETLNPLLIDMTKPTNTVFNIFSMIDAIRINHPTIHVGPHSVSDLKTLLKGTVDTMQLENGAPKVRNRFRDFFKDKQESGLSYIEILTLIPAKHQELIAQAREVSNWISLRHLDIAFGTPSDPKEHANPDKLTKLGGGTGTPTIPDKDRRAKALDPDRIWYPKRAEEGEKLLAMKDTCFRCNKQGHKSPQCFFDDVAKYGGSANFENKPWKDSSVGLKLKGKGYFHALPHAPEHYESLISAKKTPEGGKLNTVTIDNNNEKAYVNVNVCRQASGNTTHPKG